MPGDTYSCGPFPTLLLILRRTVIVLCAGLAWGTLGSYAGAVFSPVSQARAQSLDLATQAMFLAVDKNDLPGVRAAIDGGADIEARDYTGMQSVDLAIDRGYFVIAHYLISVRNKHRAGTGSPAQPTPSPKQLAATAQAAQAQPSPSGLTLPKGTPDPFHTARSGTGLPIVGDIKPPSGEVTKTLKPLKKQSASKKFIATFFDFFKPPNTTGISRKARKKYLKRARATIEAKRLKSLENPSITTARITKEASTKTPSPAPVRPQMPRMKGPPESIQKRIAVAEAAAASPPPVKNPSLPFGGRVDPDILALVNTPPAKAAPFALPQDALPLPSSPPADPFALPPDTGPDAGQESVAGLLEGLGPAQNVPTVDAKHPPPLDTTNPFASPTADPFASSADAPPSNTPGTNDLAGLLDTSSSQSGWNVKAVEGGSIPNEVVLLKTIEPTGKILDNIKFTLGTNTIIGQKVGAKRLKLLQEKTIHRPCLHKGGPDTLFCVDKVNWPPNLKNVFLVDTIMYQGTRTIARYDAGRATNFHALFNAPSFPNVVNYFTKKYGPPTRVVQRAIAPLAQPRTDNPTYIWQSREAGTDTITTLEIRKFDDARGSFPDTKRGVILLYRNHSGAIFPQLSQLELMVLKAKGEAADFKAPAPITPDKVW